MNKYEASSSKGNTSTHELQLPGIDTSDKPTLNTTSPFNFQNFPRIYSTSKRPRSTRKSGPLRITDTPKNNIENIKSSQKIKKKIPILKNSSMIPILKNSSILSPPTICKFCNAKLFKHETKNFYCGKGKISLTPENINKTLYNLYTGTTKLNESFRRHARTYNNKFAFTSLGVTYNKELCQNQKGIYTFNVQGQIYRFINRLHPIDAKPTYLQLYFYDIEHALEHHMSQSNKFESSIVQTLMSIMSSNPYTHFFRNLKHIQNIDTYKIIIKANPDMDQRIYNSPTTSQVAAIWLENESTNDYRERDIIVHKHDGESKSIRYYYGCFDPLQYPLLLPFGDPGWHEGIKLREKNTSKNTLHTEILTNPADAASVDKIVEEEEEGIYLP